MTNLQAALGVAQLELMNLLIKALDRELLQ